MDDRGIDCFLTVATTKNFIRAAQLLNLTQSTVSHRLQELERELGIALLERGRGKKEVRLTESGEEFLPLALQWRQLNEEMEVLRDSAAGHSTLRVGGLDSVKNFILLPFLRKFREEFPEIQLNLYTGSSTDMYELIAKQELDIAFVQFDLRSALVRGIPFCEEEMLVTFHPGNYSTSEIEPFQTENECMINWGSSFMHWHDSLWGSLHRVGTYCDTLFEMKGMMGKAADWAFIPASAAEWFSREGNFEVGHFPKRPPKRLILIISPMMPQKKNLHAVDSFIQILRDEKAREGLRNSVYFYDEE